MRIHMLSRENVLPVTVAFQEASMLKVPIKKRRRQRQQRGQRHKSMILLVE